MPSAKQSAAQRRALRWAQASICAGCGLVLPGANRLRPDHPDFPTFDHVIPRSRGGLRTLANGLLKHLRCNRRRGDQPPTGCDAIWQQAVAGRLQRRPRSFKTTFAGGARNPELG